LAIVRKNLSLGGVLCEEKRIQKKFLSAGEERGRLV